MEIRKIMKKPVIIAPSTTKKELLKIAKKNKTANLFIVAGKNKLFLGDIHENDLFVMLLPNDMYDEVGLEFAFDLEKKFFAKTAKQIMRKHDVSCLETDEMMDVAQQFAKEEVNEMPVLNKRGQIVGVIDQGTILRHLKLK